VELSFPNAGQVYGAAGGDRFVLYHRICKDFSYSHNDWKLASDVKNLVEPAFEATAEMSGEYYVSGSKIIPMAKRLLS
jgi:hypothetical protein